jgi:hypothetical protein
LLRGGLLLAVLAIAALPAPAAAQFDFPMHVVDLAVSSPDYGKVRFTVATAGCTYNEEAPRLAIVYLVDRVTRTVTQPLPRCPLEPYAFDVDAGLRRGDAPADVVVAKVVLQLIDDEGGQRQMPYSPGRPTSLRIYAAPSEGPKLAYAGGLVVLLGGFLARARLTDPLPRVLRKRAARAKAARSARAARAATGLSSRGRPGR